ncbi:uncharacterized protein EDB93DRAFT_1108269 [Suillus bovinus]|uniref:uncharacterized protein n=1 Tax=Suillus bovinus TaxID=48563 RepID=UPI001B87782D|nr:uncharacterized protein EDB93DRAFT_1108269 [Suillus bovinus]KAG2130823.1 hypothetical protein EDB93DRAFT_1108269 [Suillus bovinus]
MRTLKSAPPGKDFDPDNVQEGFLKGYYLKQVFRHIFTSPSSALIPDGETSTVRTCNAKLHGMEKVEPEHIAYVFIQSRFGITARDKWQETDGYYKAVFGNKNGLVVVDLREDDDDDDLVVMKRQHELRVAAMHQNTQLPENTTVAPAIAEDPATAPPTSIQQSEAADLPPVLPHAPPLSSVTHHSVDSEMESAKWMFEDFQDDDPLTKDKTDVPAPSKCARKAHKTPMASKKMRKGRK